MRALRILTNILFTAAFALTICILSVTAAFAGQTKADPTYKSNDRVSDEGLEDDYIYTFSDGKLNPKYGEPILMVNGKFFAATPVITKNNVFYAPLRGVVEALGADITRNEAEKIISIKYNDATIELIQGRYGNYGISVNGDEISGYLEPEIIDGSIYLPLQFFMRMFDLDAGYLLGSKMGIGIGIAYNPVIWLDRPGTYANSVKAQGEGLEWLKEQLNEGLKNFVINNESSDFSEDVAREAPKIAKDIENTKYVGQVGRYAMYDGPNRIILVDFDTNKIYFYCDEHTYGYIIEPDMNDPGLFMMKYVTG